MPNKTIQYVADTLNKSENEIEKIWDEAKTKIETEYDTEDNYALIMTVFKSMLGKENLDKLNWKLEEITKINTNFNEYLKEKYLRLLLEDGNTTNGLPCDIEGINELKELIYSLCDNLFKEYKSYTILPELIKIFFKNYNSEYPNMTEKSLETYYKKWLLDKHTEFENNIEHDYSKVLNNTKQDNINTEEYPNKIYMGIAFGDNLDTL